MVDSDKPYDELQGHDPAAEAKIDSGDPDGRMKSAGPAADNVGGDVVVPDEADKVDAAQDQPKDDSKKDDGSKPSDSITVNRQDEGKK